MSMPTSRAVDRVAAQLGIPCYETPTGWKYFSNLFDAGKISLCGEESFGTGSDHVREKDGLWAVLFWLNILAARKVSVERITRDHWRKYGRHYYSRHDYEALDSRVAEKVMANLREGAVRLKGQSIRSHEITLCDDFRYTDPVDHSVTAHQGVRVILSDKSRVIYRLSGTTTQTATLRIYLEAYECEPSRHSADARDALADLASAALRIAHMEEMTGRRGPSLVT
jgi:phosphoglucomutase